MEVGDAKRSSLRTRPKSGRDCRLEEETTANKILMKLDSMRALANHLETIRTRQLPRMYREILDDVGEQTKKQAQDRIIGRISPLPQTGPFNAWEPLADATIESKSQQNLGKNGNPASMLYATGELHDSIEYHVSPARKEVQIGTDVAHAAPLEYGSSHMPPRPFMGPALFIVAERVYRKHETLLTRTLNGNQTFSRRP